MYVYIFKFNHAESATQTGTSAADYTMCTNKETKTLNALR